MPHMVTINASNVESPWLESKLECNGESNVTTITNFFFSKIIEEKLRNLTKQNKIKIGPKRANWILDLRKLFFK